MPIRPHTQPDAREQALRVADHMAIAAIQTEQDIQYDMQMALDLGDMAMYARDVGAIMRQ